MVESLFVTSSAYFLLVEVIPNYLDAFGTAYIGVEAAAHWFPHQSDNRVSLCN